MPASKSKKLSKIIRLRPKKENWRTKIKIKKQQKYLKTESIMLVYCRKSCLLKHSTSIYHAEENASVQNSTQLLLISKCSPLRKQSRSIALCERLNLSGYNSRVPVPNNITCRGNNAVIHSSQISLLIGLSNCLLEEWGNQGCASEFNSKEIALFESAKVPDVDISFDSWLARGSSSSALPLPCRLTNRFNRTIFTNSDIVCRGLLFLPKFLTTFATHWSCMLIYSRLNFCSFSLGIFLKTESPLSTLAMSIETRLWIELI